MKDDNAARLRADRVFLTEAACDIDDFRALIDCTVDPAAYPFAATVVSNTLVYDGDAVRKASHDPETRRELMAEWAEALADGPGVIVVRGAFADGGQIEAANRHFWAIIEAQRREPFGHGDHFAKPGSNDRVWNALEKLCLADP